MIKGKSQGRYYRVVKRWLDVFFSTILLLLVWPIMLVIVLIIRLDSPGPALFIQDRLSLCGQVFHMYKFRSMCVNAERQGTGAYSFNNDQRITRFGAILRKLSLDELPQLINVLRGDMSFVGPRPILTYHPVRYEEYSQEEKTVFTVRPGITGWAQVHGRNSVNWIERFRYNIWYVDHVSFALDLRIIAMTFGQVFRRNEVVIQTETAKDFKDRNK